MQSCKGYALYILFTFLCLQLAACSYNPFASDSHTTGNVTGPVVGAAAGAGAMLLAHAPKPLVVLAGLGGAGLGYYMSTLRFDAGGVLRGGGRVYTLGDYAVVDIPTDNLFDSNSAEFLPGTEPILDSTAAVLARYPHDDILVSGNTSGFGSNRYERKLSEDRARAVAAYLWAHGINNFQGESILHRKLIYVGYSDYFPISNNIKMKGIRENSRIQITAYPSKVHLAINSRYKYFNNIGDSGDASMRSAPIDFSKVFPNDDLPPAYSPSPNLSELGGYSPTPHYYGKGYRPGRIYKGEVWQNRNNIVSREAFEQRQAFPYKGEMSSYKR